MNVKINDRQKSEDRTTEERSSDGRRLTKINSWRTAWRSLLTKISCYTVSQAWLFFLRNWHDTVEVWWLILFDEMRTDAIAIEPTIQSIVYSVAFLHEEEAVCYNVEQDPVWRVNGETISNAQNVLYTITMTTVKTHSQPSWTNMQVGLRVKKIK